MVLKVEIEQETDGRWLAEIVDLPGVMAYGKTSNEAKAKAQALALRVIADRLEHGEESPDLQHFICRRASSWPSARAGRLLAALLRLGWIVKRQSGSHKVLSKSG